MNTYRTTGKYINRNDKPNYTFRIHDRDFN